MKNTELDSLITRVYNAIYDLTYTNQMKPLFFLDDVMIVQIQKNIKTDQDTSLDVYSKIENSSRPFMLINANEEKSQLTTLFKIRYNNKFNTISHKDILGVLLANNIKREFIGDIVLYEDDYYFEIRSNLKNYVLENVTKIANNSVKLQEVSTPVKRIQNFQSHKYIVKSLRLDVIVKTITNLAREASQEYILLQNVKVNQVVTTNYSMQCSNNDIISIRKYGRFILRYTGTITKKGNYSITVDKYI